MPTETLKQFARAAGLAAVAALAPATAAAQEPAAAAGADLAAEFAALSARLDRSEAEVRALRARLDAGPAAVFDGPATLADPADAPGVAAFGGPVFKPAAFQDVSPPDRGVADQALVTPSERAAETAGPSAAFETRLDRLERLFPGDEEEGGLLTDSLEALSGRITDLEDGTAGFVRRGTSGATMQLFGRLHADYYAFPGTDAAAERFEGENPQDRFIFRRLRLGVKGDISTNMFYKMETEFASVNDFEIRDVYFGFRDVPALQSVTAGNQKRPYGLDHLNSSRYNVFIGRPNVIEAFNEDTRRLGIASYGVSDDLRFNWRYGVWNLERIQDDGMAIGDAYQLQAAGRLATTYWWDEVSGGRGYGHFAVSGTVADPDETGGPQNRNEARFRTRPELRTSDRWLNTGRIADAERFELLGLEHVLNYGPVQWTTEIQGVNVRRDDGSDDAAFWGAYTYVAWVLTGEHHPWSRESGTLGRLEPFEDFWLVDTCDDGVRGGSGAWEVAARYSLLDMNDADIFGGEADSLTLGLNWYWNANAGMQFNYVRGRILDSAVVDGVGGAGDPVDSNYDLLGVRFRLDF